MGGESLQRAGRQVTLDNIRAMSVGTPSGCWEWQGPINRGMRRGLISVRGERRLVYRVAYALARGGTPPQDLDHVCANSLCCNPDHLDPVTKAENSRRQRARAVVLWCPRGHAYTPENTQRNSQRWRGTRCAECHRAEARRRAAQRQTVTQ